MNYKNIAVIATLLTMAATPALADNAKKVGGGLGRFEGDRDLNLFQVEPSIINERYYTSGKSERSQYVGNVLPAGAPIPDNDAPAPVQKTPEPAKSETPTPAKTETTTPAKTEAATPTKSETPAPKKSSSGRRSGERYYTSGAAERHQHIGNTLPAGAPIPDNE